jgi:hypothetical protein
MRLHIVALVGVVGLALAATWPADAEGARAGEVLVMGGQCFVEAPGASVPLKQGDVVHVGDSIDVPQGAKLKIRLDDASIIAAAPGTKLTIKAFAIGGAEKRDSELTLEKGLLRAVVASVGEPQKFEVDTATGVAAVRGTDWLIEARPGSTQVGVLEGVVSLASEATGRAVRIPARWGARVEAGHDPVPPRVWSDAEFANDIARTNLP